MGSVFKSNNKINNQRIMKFDLTKSKPLAFFVIFLVMFFFGVVVLENVFDTAVSIERTGFNTTQSILAENDSAQTLSPTGSRITSLFANRKNQTWLSFNGTGNQINISYPANVSGVQANNKNHTWSIWFNSSNAGASDEGRLIDVLPRAWSLGIGESGNNQLGLLIYQNSNSTNYYSLNSTSAVNDSQWHHVAITFSPSQGNTSMYIDGTLNNSVFIANVTLNGTFLDISSSLSASGLDGYIDEVRLYNRTLTAAEIAEIKNSGRAKNSSLTTTGLVLYLPINENSGTDIHYINQTSGFVTVTSAVSGATWNDDNINVTLTNGTDFTLAGTDFTIKDNDLSWTGIDTLWNYIQDVGSNTTIIVRITGIFVALSLVILLFVPIFNFIRKHN